ncbi:MAG: M23 family metallopeptidase [Coriobacteriia bacterium]|nr:M23 family metallopeptidase [Coriobacteriia bacterium]
MKRLSVALCVIGLVSVVVVAQPAWAGGWSPPVSDASIALSFGAEYPGGVHRGVDIPAEAGTEVVAPSAGTVTFSGTIPADGGGTCNAVTIETGEGLRISLLPLEGLYVQTGTEVCSGDAVGRLAPLGDDSSDVSHLHMGVRRGDRYIDPAPLLQLQAAQKPGGSPVTVDVPGEPGDVAGVPNDESASVVTAPGPVLIQSSGPAVATSSASVPVVARATSAMVAETGVSVGSLARESVDLASVSPVSGGSSDSVRISCARSVDASLLRDAGVTVPAPHEAEMADAAAKGGTRWVSGRRSGLLGPIAEQPVVRALVALAAAMGGVMPIIVHAKVLAHVR